MKYVSLSGGADSTALAIYLHERGEEFELVFADTGAELPETYWIIPRIARALEVKLNVVSRSTFFQRLIARGYLLPSWRVRWCTKELKLVPLKSYSDMAVGICADEDHQMPKANRPLVDAGITKVEARRLCVKYDLLNPCYTWRTSCSCFCCPFQHKQDWRNLWREHPDLYRIAECWEEMSMEVSPTKFTWNQNFTLMQLREADEAQMSLWPEQREEACIICSV